MSYYESHRNLSGLFAGYFTQSWQEIYLWNGEKPSYQPVVRKYKTEDTQAGIEKTITQLKDIMIIGKGSDEEGWLNILTWDMSLCYYPPGDGQTFEQWLEEVLDILEEPIEETRKHWIPERI